MEKFRYFFYKYRWLFGIILAFVSTFGLILLGGWLLKWDLIKTFLSPFALLCYLLGIAITIGVGAMIYRKNRGL